MPESKIYKGDVGTVFNINAGTSLAGATTVEICMLKKDGTEVTRTGTVDGGDNTQVNYTGVAGDTDVAGVVKANLNLVIPGWSGLGETFEFEVHDKYQ